MTSSADRNRNNLRAGIFVTVTMLLAIFVLVTLADAWTMLTRREDHHQVRFEVASGVARLSPGSEVVVGGVPMGRVTAVRPDFESGGPLQWILVDFSLDDRIALSDDATILISAGVIGGGAWIDITSVGSSGRPPASGILEGQSGAMLLTTLIGPDAAADAGAIVRYAESLVRALDEDWRAHGEPTLGNLHRTSEEASAWMARVTESDWPAWAARVGEVIDWAGAATTGVDGILERGRAFTDSAAGLAEDARRIVSENEAGISAIVGGAEQATGDVTQMVRAFRDDQVIDTIVSKVETLLDTTNAAAGDARTSIESMGQAMDGWRPRISDTLANATLASQQLKLALAEVRRNPWKVLYQPTPDELQHELLYEAARSFALAAADVKGAASSLERVLEHHADRISADDPAYRHLATKLVGSLERYEIAQEELFNAILAER